MLSWRRQTEHDPIILASASHQETITTACGRGPGPRTGSSIWPSAAASPIPRIWSGATRPACSGWPWGRPPPGRLRQPPPPPLPPEQPPGPRGEPFLARCFATGAPASSAGTRARLGWTPAHPTLLEDPEVGGYFAPQPPPT